MAEQKGDKKRLFPQTFILRGHITPQITLGMVFSFKFGLDGFPLCVLQRSELSTMRLYRCVVVGLWPENENRGRYYILDASCPDHGRLQPFMNLLVSTPA